MYVLCVPSNVCYYVFTSNVCFTSVHIVTCVAMCSHSIVYYYVVT